MRKRDYQGYSIQIVGLHFKFSSWLLFLLNTVGELGGETSRNYAVEQQVYWNVENQKDKEGEKIGHSAGIFVSRIFAVVCKHCQHLESECNWEVEPGRVLPELVFTVEPDRRLSLLGPAPQKHARASDQNQSEHHQPLDPDNAHC